MAMVSIDTSVLHPTTLSCLEALQWLQSRHAWDKILDMGCGDGMLSLVAASLAGHPVSIVAADISQEAVDDTRFNYEQQRVDAIIIRSDGFQHAAIKDHAPYDLIICNLLAEPITQWSPQMRDHLAPGGVCVLSGILAWLAPGLEAAYQRLGFEILHTVQVSPWVTHVMRLPSGAGNASVPPHDHEP